MARTTSRSKQSPSSRAANTRRTPKRSRRATTPTRIARFFSFRYRKHSVRVLLDRVLLFRLMRRLHGRFWGVAGLGILGICLIICGFIRPDILRDPNGALSMFGTDTRTAPWFAFGMFFAAYGMWNWRNYLLRTLRHKRPMSWLIGLTIAGLLIVAFMPMDWKPIVSQIHIIGFSLIGVSMVATVVADSTLTKVRPRRHLGYWRLLRVVSLLSISVGGVLSFGSLELIGWWQLMLIGELIMIGGYSLWVGLKTHLGEGRRSALSRLLSRIVLVD